jgi:hypothetical protein
MSAARRIAWRVAVAAVFAVGGSFAQEGSQPGEPQRANRWVIEFSGGEFTLQSRSLTTKVLPASDELPAVQLPHSGFWFELRAADGSVRYRHVTGNPVLLVFEGPALEDGNVVPTVARSETYGPDAPAGRGQGRIAEMHGKSQAATPQRATLARQTTADVIRDEAIPDERVFTLLTPAAGQGEALVLFSSPLAPNSQGAPATEVARFVVQPEIP